MQSERVIAAYHEAGHATAAYRLGAAITSVLVEADGSAGITSSIEEGASIAESLIISSAGDVGQMLAPRGHDRHAWNPPPEYSHLKTDSVISADAIACVRLQQESEFLQLYAFSQACVLLTEYSDALHALAQLLSRRLVLDGDDVRALFRTFDVQPFVPAINNRAIEELAKLCDGHTASVAAINRTQLAAARVVAAAVGAGENHHG